MADKRKSLIKIKPKKFKDGEIVKVSFMVMHPMDTGMSKDKKTKKIIPATYMKINGKGKLTVTYTDNTGEVHEKSKKIKPKG